MSVVLKFDGDAGFRDGLLKDEYLTMLIANVTKALLGLLILSSLWSLMHAFMGGSEGDFQSLDSLQFSGILFSILATLACILLLARNRGIFEGLKVAWLHIPGWLVFGSIVVVSLAVIGELAYYLLRDAVWIPADWFNHSALFCLALSTFAFLLVSGTGRFLTGGGPYLKERW